MTLVLFGASTWILAASCGRSDTGSSTPAKTDSTSNAEAREILAGVLSAAGGQEAINRIRTLAVQYVNTRFPTTPGDTTAAPSLVDVLQVRDFENGRHLYEVYAGGEAWERVVVLQDGAFSVNLLTNQTTRLAANALTGARYGGIQLRWYVYAALGEAIAAGGNLRHPRDTTLNDRTYHVVTYPGIDTETVEMWVDAESNLIARRQVSAHDPIMGSNTARITYEDYADFDGIPMPMMIMVFDGDRPYERFDMQEIRINAQIQERAFQPPSP